MYKMKENIEVELLIKYFEENNCNSMLRAEDIMRSKGSLIINLLSKLWRKLV